MTHSIIQRYSGPLHNLSDQYLKGPNEQILLTVKTFLEQIDQYNSNLGGVTRDIHDELMRSMIEDSPNEFMLNVLSKSCAYSIDVT